MKFFLPCPHCDGSGERLLNGVYLETLRLLRRKRERISGADLARLVGCKATAMNNRLAVLKRLGLANRVVVGRRTMWAAVK